MFFDISTSFAKLELLAMGSAIRELNSVMRNYLERDKLDIDRWKIVFAGSCSNSIPTYFMDNVLCRFARPRYCTILRCSPCTR